MRFPRPLVGATLVRRYKRFLADVVLDDGRKVTAHCPNPGSMMGLSDPGLRVWLSPAASPKRKLPFTWELVFFDDGPQGPHLVGINTGHPNRLVEEAIVAGRIPELGGYATIRREVKYGKSSRIDLLLEDPTRPSAYVEVKNVHLLRPDRHNGRAAEFPDCVTARGAKHLEELADMVAAGHRAMMVYCIQRSDCDHFRLAEDLDPAYAIGLLSAVSAGVEVAALATRTSIDGIDLVRPLPVVLPGGRAAKPGS